jgi:cob(I)alamin adenosyltransferase
LADRIVIIQFAESERTQVSDEYIDRLEKEIIALKAMLEPLESGQIQVGAPDEPLDRTLERIAELKRKIAQAQSIVDRHYAQGP